MNVEKDVLKNYVAMFLVVETEENSEGLVPKIEGLNNFDEKIIDSIEYRNGAWTSIIARSC
ncbi:hypothetical protein HAX54_035325, partial [Datura stramonium]|nr:hypothetical protein [Datura stramonium]